MNSSMMRVVRREAVAAGSERDLFSRVIVNQVVVHSAAFWMVYSQTGSLVGGLLAAVFPIEAMGSVVAYMVFLEALVWAGSG